LCKRRCEIWFRIANGCSTWDIAYWAAFQDWILGSMFHVEHS